ncbi:MAG: dihydroorotase [Bacteroidetes bacterium]|nr:MAG: dihydroorotase [Bacteroidota bacterium]
MDRLLIKNALVVNEGKTEKLDLLIADGKIAELSSQVRSQQAVETIDASGLHLFPGLIDDQVHFREPGLTHKADIGSESRAAVAGGVTSYMEMPNTVPGAVTQETLAWKYARAAETSAANYSFFMGTTNNNLEEVLKTDPRNVCGIKIFMGSSTGDMLVDNTEMLEGLFSQVNMLIATHCEDDVMIRHNLAAYKEKYGDDIPVRFHPLIRSREACYSSSAKAVTLAKKYGTRLHVLHISTAEELALFENNLPLRDKKITAEACVHHLWFSDADYETRGNFIKWNPAVKTSADRDAILKAVLDNRIDVIATDHAPHTREEKKQAYVKAPSGGPLVQHALISMLELAKQGKITHEKIAEKMCHAPAELFRIEKRGYIREGYHADLVLVNMHDPREVNSANILSKCGWSPFEGITFSAGVTHTFVNGQLVYHKGVINERVRGQRLLFNN